MSASAGVANGGKDGGCAAVPALAGHAARVARTRACRAFAHTFAQASSIDASIAADEAADETADETSVETEGPTEGASPVGRVSDDDDAFSPPPRSCRS